MNLSRSISLSLMDQQGNAIPLRTTVDQPLEMIIPRDPSFRLPPMSLQNVTSMTNDSLDHRLFNLHSMDFTPTSSSSSLALHLEVHPLSVNLSYLMIYRFDYSPILNSSFSQIDGWSLFCPSTNESIYTHFFGNNQTFGHRSLIFGLRELNSTDWCSTPIVTPPLTDERFRFTSNYELRLYTSSCFYFDEKSEEWKSDGLTVGRKSNHFETQCFSTHI